MVAFGSNGASVFMGQHNGAAMSFWQKLCYLLAVHCVAHRTVLVMGDVTCELRQMGEIDSLCKSVHALFSKSSKWQGEWEHFAKLHGCMQLSSRRTTPHGGLATCLA